eukprot:9703598-Alexandrium_andersonii.AAC.1
MAEKPYPRGVTAVHRPPGLLVGGVPRYQFRFRARPCGTTTAARGAGALLRYAPGGKWQTSTCRHPLGVLTQYSSMSKKQWILARHRPPPPSPPPPGNAPPHA